MTERLLFFLSYQKKGYSSFYLTKSFLSEKVCSNVVVLRGKNCILPKLFLIFQTFKLIFQTFSNNGYFCNVLLIQFSVFQYDLLKLKENYEITKEKQPPCTAQKMKLSVKDFFSKCKHLRNKFLTGSFIFCAVTSPSM